MKKSFAIAAILFLIAGCSGVDDTATKAALAAVDQGALLIDVRSEGEFKGGAFEGAINIPHTAILEGVTQLSVSKTQPVVVYCRSGNRSGIAKTALEQAGFTQVINGGSLSNLEAARNASSDQG